MAHAYRHPETSMGIILGTGTNAGEFDWSSNLVLIIHNSLL